MFEFWRGIENCSNYEVSNFGRVRSLDKRTYVKPTSKRVGYFRNKKGQIIKNILNMWGYLSVGIYLNSGKRTTIFVHQLVARAFIPNPENKSTVNHINANKEDNTVENLEWATNMEQTIHCIENNLMDNKVAAQRVEAYNREGILVGTYQSQKQCAIKLGFSNHQSRISEILLGKRKSYKGYTFKRI